MSLASPVPPHVPADRIYDFDFLAAPELLAEPHRQVLKLHREAPEIFWTPRNGGHWLVPRAAPALEMLRRYEDFSAQPRFNRSKDRWPRTVPNQYDPPEHTEFRRILNPWFSPAAVNRREEEIRQLSAELIDAVLDRGECEFVHDIAEHFSVTIFMQMVEAPMADRRRLITMAERYTHSPDQQEREAGLKELATYLTDIVEERRRNPGTDLVSDIVRAQFKGRPLDHDELIGMATLVFLGGLDTVTAMLSFVMAFLGRNPDHYARLTADPAFIGTASEELMRVHGVAMMERGATHAFEFRGVHFEPGDRIVFMPQIYGLDDQQMSDPERVDFDRELSGHLVFGSGAHRCIGSHLARIELRLFLEEWVKRVPRFTLEQDAPLRTSGGLVWQPLEVPLRWDAPAQAA
ncbi:cytochrome P450 [Sphingomonas sp. 1P06PA]|uniref:cytochrome P450 n=1 Tax=Sphingomonas sp. 1P06PA TaxID=554121 RepID=UPI0039A6D3AA